MGILTREVSMAAHAPGATMEGEARSGIREIIHPAPKKTAATRLDLSAVTPSFFAIDMPATSHMGFVSLAGTCYAQEEFALGR